MILKVFSSLNNYVILWFYDSFSTASFLQPAFSQNPLLLLKPHLPIFAQAMSIFVFCFSPVFLTHALHWKILGDNSPLLLECTFVLWGSESQGWVRSCSIHPIAEGTSQLHFGEGNGSTKQQYTLSAPMEPRAETKCLESLSPGLPCLIWVGWLGSDGAAGREGPMKLCRRMELFLGIIYISLKLLCHLNA